jgi:lipopolysaccharide export system permease protein
MPVIVSVFTFIAYYILESMGTKLARQGEIPVWWGSWMSTAVLAPLGVFLTHQANRDSGVFNIDIYKDFLRRLLALRIKRYNGMKEVIIDDPCYRIVTSELAQLTAVCEEYASQHLHKRFPNYVVMFSVNGNRDISLLRLDAQLEHCVEQLSNSRIREILNLLNSYPVLGTRAHLAPFSHRWMNVMLGALFPAGVVVYARALFFRQRLREDMNTIIKTNKEIQNIIYERKL